MAVTLEYSVDRGANWLPLSAYTHPTTAGVHQKRIDLSPKLQIKKHVRFRLTGTDAADWGLHSLVLVGIRVGQEQEML